MSHAFSIISLRLYTSALVLTGVHSLNTSDNVARPASVAPYVSITAQVDRTAVSQPAAAPAAAVASRVTTCQYSLNAMGDGGWGEGVHVYDDVIKQRMPRQTQNRPQSEGRKGRGWQNVRVH